GRFRTVTNGVTTAVAKGVLDMSGDSIARIANDMFLDVGIGEVYLSGNALVHIGNDFRAASADYGEGKIMMSGSSKLKVEGRFSIADSSFTTMDMTMSGNSGVEVGVRMVVGGQNDLNKSGVAVVNIEDNATINVGAFLYRGDVDGAVDAEHIAGRVA